MNDIAAPIIGVVGAVVGGGVQPLYAFLRERNAFPKLEDHLLRALTDVAWRGQLEVVYREDRLPIHAPGIMTLTLRKSPWSPMLTGSMHIERHDGTKADLVVEHGVMRDRHLLLHYRNQNSVVKHAGAICLTLSDLADTLTGYFSGWSPWSNTHTCGKMTLTK